MECTTTNVELEYFYMKVIDMVYIEEEEIGGYFGDVQGVKGVMD